MLKYFFAGFALLHGLIHFMGFAKAFNYGNITQLTKTISKASGSLWLISALLFIIAVILFLSGKGIWAYVGILAVIISQVLIIEVWKDAKFGTIANFLILLVAIAGVASGQFERKFKMDVASNIKRTAAADKPLVTETDLAHLPPIVQKYLRYTGVLNKPRINNIHIVFEGEMRSRKQKWFRFRSEQYNFFDDPARLFFMKGRLFGIDVPGYHAYQQGKATMQIKLFGLFYVVNGKGKDMDKGETVTLFNDLCLFAPAALIDKRIQWEPVDSLTVKAIFTNHGITIAALLYFTDAGQLINFISDDRFEITDKKYYRFSTPVRGYKQIDGYNLPTYGEAVWHYPEGDFTYGKFWVKKIIVNGEWSIVNGQ